VGLTLTIHTKQILTGWLNERRPAAGTAPLFCTRSGSRLSHDAVEHLIKKHAATTAETCTSLQTKKVTPHTLRHTTAMELL
jgi:integrase/recombinase XerD